MGRIFVDTNVLFPFSVMDLLLALSEDGIHEVIWTETLLDEWEEVIVREHHRTAESAASITAPSESSSRRARSSDPRTGTCSGKCPATIPTTMSTWPRPS
jgi:hypothetical protein